MGRQTFDQDAYDRREPMNIIVSKPAQQNIYCVKCRRKVLTECCYKTLRNGTVAVFAVHHECGTPMYKFTSIRITSTKDMKEAN